MDRSASPGQIRQKLAVIGAGVSGLSCAWLLSRDHDVTLYEGERRLGGHANTCELTLRGRTVAVDTGFIVYNEPTYPNLTALFDHVSVETAPTDMSFSVSLDGGAYEYAGKDFRGLFAQPANVFKPRFWSMIRDLLRFYRDAPGDLPRMGEISLGDYLAQGGYGEAFIRDHLFPMAAAIWSTPAADVGAYPAAAFIRFCDNHGLLKLAGRPVWRTVRGGSQSYVRRLAKKIPGHSARRGGRARQAAAGWNRSHRHARRDDRFDQVVIAAHADVALSMLERPTVAERSVLGAFRYASNVAFLHGDASLMPRRKAAWAAWNYLAEGRGAKSLAVSYWMNALQPLGSAPDLFVTLNPPAPPRDDLSYRLKSYRHPQFDVAAMSAQKTLWSLQGVDRIWYCGAYFGAGFHEDGLQAGLAVAEQLGGGRRPWRVADESGRIALDAAPRALREALA